MLYKQQGVKNKSNEFTKFGTDLRFLITFDKGIIVITLFSKRNLNRIINEKI